MDIFSKRLRELRQANNYTQTQMAEFLQIRQQSYLRYELGSGEPSLETLVQISKIFDVSCDYLLGESITF